jgi:hypothetical protein
MKNIQLGSWHEMQRVDFLGCLRASIACVGLGRISHLLGKGYAKFIPKSVI